MILHIPHASTLIPASVRHLFVLDDDQLAEQNLRICDAWTDELYDVPGVARAVFPVSRLVVDPERFLDDALEPMARFGMGAIYMRTCDGRPLKRALSDAERTMLLATYYHPHHNRLTELTADELRQRGHALIFDCHSFPSQPVPCDLDQTSDRPPLCIGSDATHTPPDLLAAVEQAIDELDIAYAINRPYAGALVPLAYYNQDLRVASIMLEIRRDLYMDEHTGEKSAAFHNARAIARTVLAAAQAWQDTL